MRSVLPLLIVSALPIKSWAACSGDCDGDARVVASEVVKLVRIAIGQLPESSCPTGEANGDQQAGGSTQVFTNCRAAELQMCLPQ